MIRKWTRRVVERRRTVGCVTPASFALYGAIFDTDGVITRTASVHLAAWKRVFDDLLRELDGSHAAPFTDAEYRRDVDGLDRYDGVANFLASRGVELPRGTADDPPGHGTLCAIGNLKNAVFLDHLRTEGVEAYPGTVRLIERLRADGVGTAAVSASRNCAAVLDSADVAELFDTLVDGLDAAELGLALKPHPDLYLEAARRLRVATADAAVIEDAVAGVEAGRRGGFGVVVGVDRTRHASELERYADLVVPDLADIEWSGSTLVRSAVPSSPLLTLPSALVDGDVSRQVTGRRLAVFLADGTLTPTADRGRHAVLATSNRRALTELAAVVPVGIVGDHDLDDLRTTIGLDGLWYAGRHGSDLLSPDGQRQQIPEGENWDKGRVLAWMLAVATQDDISVLPVYLGADETDEDAFRVLRSSGLGVVVGGGDRNTAAHCRLAGPDEVAEFLARLTRSVNLDE